MTQQVDWNWQIQNKPSSFPGTYDNVPSDGPFSGSPLLFTPSTGIQVSAGPIVDLLLATLNQWGVIGTAGGQSLQGPFYLYRHGAAPSPPTLWADEFPLGIISGGIGFMGGGESSDTFPLAYIEYQPVSSSPYPLVISAPQLLTIQGSTHNAADVVVENVNSGANLTLVPTGGGSTLYDPTLLALSLGSSGQVQLTQGFYPGHGGVLMYTDNSGTEVFGINNTHFGVWGTLGLGAPVAGGIVTGLGSSSASGDLTGSYPGPTITSLQGNPLLASGTITSGDVLTWNGTDWIPQATGTPTQIVNDGGSVVINSSGAITATTATSQGFTINSNGATFAVEGSGTILGQVPSGSLISLQDVSGVLGWILFPGFGSYTVYSGGANPFMGVLEPDQCVMSTNAGGVTVYGSSGDIVTGQTIATSATGGFLYLPNCPGVPTGTPNAYSGQTPLVYDTTSGVLYGYNSGWSPVAPSGTGTVTSVATIDSITGGTIRTSGTLSLVNDASSPGANMMYGTDASGVKGWQTIPAPATAVLAVAAGAQSGITSGSGPNLLKVSPTGSRTAYRLSGSVVVTASGGVFTLIANYTEDGHAQNTTVLTVTVPPTPINGAVPGSVYLIADSNTNVSWTATVTGGTFDLWLTLEQVLTGL